MSAPVLSRIGGTRAGVWLIGNVISPFQRWVIRTSGGRVTLTGKPVLLLTAIGRRSGTAANAPAHVPPRRRQSHRLQRQAAMGAPKPVAAQRPSQPRSDYPHQGCGRARIARDARPDEIERLWPRLVELWPPYERFFARTHERAIFVLEVPAPKPPPPGGPGDRFPTGLVRGLPRSLPVSPPSLSSLLEVGSAPGLPTSPFLSISLGVGAHATIGYAGTIIAAAISPALRQE